MLAVCTQKCSAPCCRCGSMFGCVCLVLGLIFRQVPKVPYTVLLLLGGFLFDLIIKLMITAGMTEPEFYAIMGDLDPHVILFVFLPALIT